MSLFDDWPEIVCNNAPLAPLTWFKLGGNAEFLIEPRTDDELAGVIRRCRDSNTPLRFLGLGANLIVRDEGVLGAVVRLSTEHFTRMIFDGPRLTVGAGTDMTKMVLASVKKGLAGLEHIAGIPGTVGGGIAMNCGGKYGDLGTSVRSVRVIARDGEIYERDHDDLDFAYRHSALGDDCVLSVTFELSQTDPVALDRRFREIWMYKQNTQPPLGCQSVGCIFRNPEGKSAGQLIDQAGLKGHRLGTAYVSDRHANFVLADQGGLAHDVISLIDLIADTVDERFGIRLETEVKIW
ncbi:MAG: UDP-N-acetylmuramate dehydrogenase [Planctomycetota bacterium]